MRTVGCSHVAFSGLLDKGTKLFLRLLPWLEGNDCIYLFILAQECLFIHLLHLYSSPFPNQLWAVVTLNGCYII